MRKITSFMLVALLAVMAMATLARAGEREGAFSISPYVGGYVFDEHDRNGQVVLRQNRIDYGLRLGYDITDYFGTELVGSYARAETKKHITGSVKRFNDWSYHMDLLYNITPHSPLVPYLVVGGGGHSTEYPTDNSATDGTFHTGLGLKMFMSDSFALRADGRHIFLYSYKTLHNWEYSLGLSWLFGGRQAAVAMVETPPPAPPVEQPQVAEPTPGHYKYCVTMHIEFDIDKDIIRPEYKDEIAKVGDFMKKYPTTTAVIEGHTDNVGTAEHNMDLSQRRAESVVNYLVENFGIDRSRLTAKGYGFTRPVADNATDEGRQKNRRIEAIIDCAFDVREIQPPERLCMSLVMDFDSGSASVKPEYRGEIAKVADYMKQYPTTTAVIEGHTDNTGSDQENMKLSQRRAEAVVNYLVENFGIDRSRLSAKGYGSTRRVAYNETAEGRAKNRRINAVIDCVIKK